MQTQMKDKSINMWVALKKKKTDNIIQQQQCSVWLNIFKTGN